MLVEFSIIYRYILSFLCKIKIQIWSERVEILIWLKEGLFCFRLEFNVWSLRSSRSAHRWATNLSEENQSRYYAEETKLPKEEVDIVMDREKSRVEFTKFSRICLHGMEIRMPLVKINGLDSQFLKRGLHEMGLLMPSLSSEKWKTKKWNP